MNAQELIDRYVHEVGQKLPRRVRGDIKLELRSSLEESLAHMKAADDTDAAKLLAAELIEEYGSPAELAARYVPQRPLISPELFPVYRLVLLVIFGVQSFFYLIALGFTIARGGGDSALWPGLGNLLLDYGQALILALGWVTLVFGVIEWLAVRFDWQGKESKSKEEAWNPFDLPPVSDPDRIKPVDLSLEIGFTMVAIVLFNVFPEFFSLFYFSGEETSVTPLLAPPFWALLPWVTAYWSLEILLNVGVLAQGRWRRWSRWADFALKLFGINVIVRLYQADPISLIPFLDTLMHWALVVAGIVTAVEALRQLLRLLFGDSGEPDLPLRSRTA